MRVSKARSPMGRLGFRTGAAMLATALALLTGAPASAYDVKEMGSFFVGGHGVTLSGLPTREIVFRPGAPPLISDPNGEFEAGQMYVHDVRLSAPRFPLPLLMWHGGGLTGATFETKPDGAAGWEKVQANARRYADALKTAGVAVDFIELPSIGIAGNSHMLMMDDNSDQVARMISDWLTKNIN